MFARKTGVRHEGPLAVNSIDRRKYALGGGGFERRKVPIIRGNCLQIYFGYLLQLFRGNDKGITWEQVVLRIQRLRLRENRRELQLIRFWLTFNRTSKWYPLVLFSWGRPVIDSYARWSDILRALIDNWKSCEVFKSVVFYRQTKFALIVARSRVLNFENQLILNSWNIYFHLVLILASPLLTHILAHIISTPLFLFFWRVYFARDNLLIRLDSFFLLRILLVDYFKQLIPQYRVLLEALSCLIHILRNSSWMGSFPTAIFLNANDSFVWAWWRQQFLGANDLISWNFASCLIHWSFFERSLALFVPYRSVFWIFFVVLRLVRNAIVLTLGLLQTFGFSFKSFVLYSTLVY